MQEKQASLRQELYDASKLEAVGIAHEINTPLQYTGDNLLFLDAAHGVLAGAPILAKPLSPIALARNVREMLDGALDRAGAESMALLNA